LTEFIRCHVLRNVHGVLLGTTSSLFENFLEQFVYCLEEGKEAMALSNHNKNRICTKVGGRRHQVIAPSPPWGLKCSNDTKEGPTIVLRLVAP